MAASVDFLARTTSQSLDSGSGFYTFTSAGLGTPCAALVLMVAKGTLEADAAVIGMGFTDGTNEYCFATRALEGVTTADSSCIERNDCVAYVPERGAAAGEKVVFSTWVTDGVELELLTNPTDGEYQLVVVLFGGTGTTAQVVTADLAAASVTPVSMSIHADVLIGFSMVAAYATGFNTWDNTVVAGMWTAVRDGSDTSITQGLVTMMMEGGVSATTARGRRAKYTDRIVDRHGFGAGVPAFHGHSVTEMSSSDVEFTGDISSPDERVCFLALDLPSGTLAKMNVDHTTPIVTGTETSTWPGFEAGLVLGFHSAVGNATGLQNGAAFAWGVTDQRSSFAGSCRMRNATSPVQCTSKYATGYMAWCHDPRVNVQAYSAEFDSENASGYVMDYDSVEPLDDRHFIEVAFIERVALVVPTGIASGEAFGTTVLVPGAVTVTPSAIASAEAVGTPTVVAGNVNVSPSGIASAEAFGTAALTAGVVVITPSGIASAEAFGAVTLAPGTVTVVVSSIASGEAFGTTVLAPGALTIVVSGIASAEAFGTLSLLTSSTLAPDGIVSGEEFGTPSLNPGLVSLIVSAIASGEVFGTAVLAPGGLTIVVSGIASAGAFGTPVLASGAATVTPAGIASGEAWGTPLLLMVGQQIIYPSGIPSAEALGRPFLSGGEIPMTLKKKIHDALCEAAQQGTFLAASYDSEACELEQGAQVQPASIEANEVSSAYEVEQRHGRKFLQDFKQWQWLVILRFNQEVICEPWVRALLEDPLCIKREDGEDRQVHLLLLDAQYEHPPREGSSNGTLARFKFEAKLSPR